MPRYVTVVGSVNIDLVATVTALPRPGETVSAVDYAQFLGGKGSNQAIAAARLGSSVTFVGLVGEDAESSFVRESLAAESIDTSHVAHIPGVPTGRAMIMVDAAAENCIVIVAGANGRLDATHVRGAQAAINSATVVVSQLETPLDAVIEAARLADGLFILNPAPAPAQPLPDELLSLVDMLVVNEIEYEAVLGRPLPTDLPELLDELAAGVTLPYALIITAGERGALVWDGSVLTEIPTPSVTAVDTTGAGDTFIGALADSLSRGENLLTAAQWAVHAGSIAVGSLGATTGMPRAQAVQESVALARARAPDYRALTRKEAGPPSKSTTSPQS
jgi:ribokinase